jgi:energy-converting hydrogenase Eha subunit C
MRSRNDFQGVLRMGIHDGEALRPADQKTKKQLRGCRGGTVVKIANDAFVKDMVLRRIPMQKLINLLQYALVITGIAAVAFLNLEIAGYILYAWTGVATIAMLITLFICHLELTQTVDPKNPPIPIIIQYKIFNSYWTGRHLPASIDALFYFIIVVMSGLYNMLFISTAWIAISFCDFKLRDMANESALEFVAKSKLLNKGK